MIKLQVQHFLFASLITFCAVISFAQELVKENRSVRALGMGDSYTAIATGHDALFYNPAALSKSHGFSWEIFDLRAGADGADTYTVYKNLTSNVSYVSALQGLFGKTVQAGVDAKSSVSVGSLAVSVYNSAFLAATLVNPALPSLNVNVINDYGTAIGTGFELAGGFSWGLTARKVNRFGSNIPIGVDSLIALSSTNLQNLLSNQGVGYALDSGLLFAVSDSTLKPTFSFVWKDIGVTTFQPLTAVAPPQQNDEMIAGFGLELSGLVFKLRPSIEIQNLNDPSAAIGKKVHAGVELSMPLIDLRAGLYQGYYTAGVGIDLGFIRVDAATYEVERGVYPGQDGDRRYSVEATLILSFDPDFSFLNTSGKKAIIQRR